MLDVSHEYIVYVGDKDNYIIKVQTFSRNNAVCVAHALADNFQEFNILIEEWRFVFSPNLFECGLFKGEVITIPAINRKEVA